MNSKRNYALAMDELASFCKERQQPISRGLLLAFREALLERNLGPSTINVKLSAVRKLVREARRASVISGEEAAQMTDVPNIRSVVHGWGTGLRKSKPSSCWQCPIDQP